MAKAKSEFTLPAACFCFAALIARVAELADAVDSKLRQAIFFRPAFRGHSKSVLRRETVIFMGKFMTARFLQIVLQL
jgi:hypothetical protein